MQGENLAFLFGAVAQMNAEGVAERSFDPPILGLATSNGNASILGGSGEFEDAKGFAREFTIVHELNLSTRAHTVTTVVQFALRTKKN